MKDLPKFINKGFKKRVRKSRKKAGFGSPNGYKGDWVGTRVEPDPDMTNFVVKCGLFSNVVKGIRKKYGGTPEELDIKSIEISDLRLLELEGFMDHLCMKMMFAANTFGKVKDDYEIEENILTYIDTMGFMYADKSEKIIHTTIEEHEKFVENYQKIDNKQTRNIHLFMDEIIDKYDSLIKL